MPLLNVFTSAEPLPAERAGALLKALSASLAEHFHKPEAYVMTCIVPRTCMTFGGTTEPACYAEVKNVGSMTPALTAKLSALICSQLGEAFGVPSDRIYVEFSEARGHLWGHDGETFG